MIDVIKPFAELARERAKRVNDEEDSTVVSRFNGQELTVGDFRRILILYDNLMRNKAYAAQQESDTLYYGGTPLARSR